MEFNTTPLESSDYSFHVPLGGLKGPHSVMVIGRIRGLEALGNEGLFPQYAFAYGRH